MMRDGKGRKKNELNKIKVIPSNHALRLSFRAGMSLIFEIEHLK